MVLAMVDMLLPMPTTERGPLMPSLRPRLMLTMELTDILVLAMLVPMVPMVPMVLAMLDMLLPMPMVPTTERGPLMLSPRLMPTMELTDMLVLAMLDMAMVPMVLAMLDMLLPMPMVPTMELTDMLVLATDMVLILFFYDECLFCLCTIF